MGRKAIDEELESQLPLIISMFKQGASEKEIIEKLGISASTWKRKKAQNKLLKEALEEATDYRNQEVEEALFKCCKGYHYYEEVVTKVKEEHEGSQGQTLIKERVEINTVKRFKPADVIAQKYWLNNRKAKDWKDDPNKVKNDKEVIKLKKKELDMKDLGI